MKQIPSSEACSALIEYWAKEYKRLYGTSGRKLPVDAQIPPREMKKYIDNYKKWYESTPNKDETKAKLAILKRYTCSLWQKIWNACSGRV